MREKLTLNLQNPIGLAEASFDGKPPRIDEREEKEERVGQAKENVLAFVQLADAGSREILKSCGQDTTQGLWADQVIYSLRQNGSAGSRMIGRAGRMGSKLDLAGSRGYYRADLDACSGGRSSVILHEVREQIR